MKHDIVGKKFPGGTLVHLNGLPFALFSDTYLVGHANNFKLAAGERSLRSRISSFVARTKRKIRTCRVVWG